MNVEVDCFKPQTINGTIYDHTGEVTIHLNKNIFHLSKLASLKGGDNFGYYINVIHPFIIIISRITKKIFVFVIIKNKVNLLKSCSINTLLNDYSDIFIKVNKNILSIYPFNEQIEHNYNYDLTTINTSCIYLCNKCLDTSCDYKVINKHNYISTPPFINTDLYERNKLINTEPYTARKKEACKNTFMLSFNTIVKPYMLLISGHVIVILGFIIYFTMI